MIDACRVPFDSEEGRPYDMILLDEINIALRYDYLPLGEVVDFLGKRPEMLPVIVTGRNAKPELIDAAALVTEITQVKHTFSEQNVRAQKGTEFCIWDSSLHPGTGHNPTGD